MESLVIEDPSARPVSRLALAAVWLGLAVATAFIFPVLLGAAPLALAFLAWRARGRPRAVWIFGALAHSLLVYAWLVLLGVFPTLAIAALQLVLAGADQVRRGPGFDTLALGRTA